MKIGNSPESWGVFGPSDPSQVPWDRCLDEIAESGFELVELGPYGYLPTDPDRLGKELDQRGLAISAATVIAPLEDASAWPDIENQINRGGELVAPIGAKHIVLIDDIYSSSSARASNVPSRLDDRGWKQLIETTHRAADLVRERFGLEPTFHPCADTHVEYEEQIEAFLEQTDPGRVALCLDTGHHAYRGGDPVRFARKYHDRIAYLHLKSVDGDLRKRVNAENIPVEEATKMGVFCEPADGAVDLKAFGDVLREIDYDGLAIVEQDMFRPDHDAPLGIATRTREYLREVGVG